MKKLLISIIIILLLVFSYFTLIKGVSGLNIKSINQVRSESEKLNNDYNEANELTNKTYPDEKTKLEEAIKKLKISKKDFENKSKNETDKISLGTVEIKTYKIHYLWTILGNYRKNRGVQALNLDLKATNAEDVYDLEFTLQGNYTSITDFLYDIENDEELNFEIKDFTISSDLGTVSTSTTQTSGQNADNTNTTDNANSNNENNNSQTSGQTSNQSNTSNTSSSAQGDGITLQARFTVEDIGITLD